LQPRRLSGKTESTMSEHAVLGIAIIIALGIAAQWTAWRFRLPAILLFLLFGFLAGPVTGVLDPDEIFGDLLTPLISISVAIILFEGGLNLRFSELTNIRRIVFSLISLGALVTWAVASLTAMLVLGIETRIAILLGAILVVSGPTVIVPLLRHVRPIGRIGSVLRWEGILIDPIGATLAVLVFEAIISHSNADAAGAAATGFLKTVVAGGALGYLGAKFLVEILRRDLVPDYLHNAVAFLMVIGVFALSNSVQGESGLLAATIMGIVMANQPHVDIRHILQFKETLSVLLISSIFVVLAARLRIGDFLSIDILGGATFLASLIFIARPLSVAVSTARSRASLKERLFLMSVAPRGIVAAAVASVFAIKLEEAGFAQAKELVPLTFLVIVGTVVIYGLSAGPIARRLRVASPDPQGILIVGAHPLGRAIAKAIAQLGFETLLVDTNWSNICAARLEGLPARFGSALTDDLSNDLVLGGIGRMAALTSNDEVNSLAALHFAKAFGRSEVYQLAPKEGAMDDHMRGRILFDAKATYAELTGRLEGGGRIKTIKLTKEFDCAAFRSLYGESALPLFSTDGKGGLTIVESGKTPLAGEEQTVIALVEGATAEADNA